MASIKLFSLTQPKHAFSISSAGYSWSYNTQLYMDEYYPEVNPGVWLAMCSIIGGSFGVFFGGWFSDLAVRRLGLYSRLWILSVCLVRKERTGYSRNV